MADEAARAVIVGEDWPVETSWRDTRTGAFPFGTTGREVLVAAKARRAAACRDVLVTLMTDLESRDLKKKTLTKCRLRCPNISTQIMCKLEVTGGGHAVGSDEKSGKAAEAVGARPDEAVMEKVTAVETVAKA